MDIARIRKKLKEAKKKKSSKTKSAGTEDVSKGEDDKPVPVKETVLSEPEERLQGETVPAEVRTLPEKSSEHETVEVEEEAEESIEFLKFTVGSDAYAFRLSEIEEILRPKKITVVPRTNPYVLGITSFRGKIIPVVDIGKKFTAEKDLGEEFEKAKIVILRGPKDSIGVPVVGRMDVILLPESDIMEPPLNMTDNERKLVEGVAMRNNGFITVVRLEEVLDFNLTGEA